jgi:hypothetical protein
MPVIGQPPHGIGCGKCHGNLGPILASRRIEQFTVDLYYSNPQINLTHENVYSDEIGTGSAANRHSFRLKSALVPMQIGTPCSG